MISSATQVVAGAPVTSNARTPAPRGLVWSPWIWGPIAAVALFWPGRFRGPLDGMPLDGPIEAVILGLVFPALWCFHPRFLRSPFGRACIIAILGLKVIGSAAFARDGWCVWFEPTAPIVKDGGAGAPHSWDVRADWRTEKPTCSAVVTRSYEQSRDFPAWFFNLPPPRDDLPGATDRPPHAAFRMIVSGYVFSRNQGVLQVVTGPDMDTIVAVDGVLRSTSDPMRHQVPLQSGLHALSVDATITGDRWRFVPAWNGSDLWSASSVVATLSQPSRIDRTVRPFASWATTIAVATLMLAWLWSAGAHVRNGWMLLWTIGAAACLGTLALDGQNSLARWAVTALSAAVLVPAPQRYRNVRGAFLLIGVPWLTLIAIAHIGEVGRFTLYSAGDDWWTFQRFAYRIYLQGYWLEGGQRTFWFQPLYRWIAGALHMVFGDSSVGEFYWDGACLLVVSLFAFDVVREVAGFRWGLVAAMTSLTMVRQGPGWDFIGRGLSEISSAGLISLGALLAIRSRTRGLPVAILAGALATLGFYTRLNNLPMAVGISAFAMPLSLPTRVAIRPHSWVRQVAPTPAAGIAATLCLGLLLFAWRTWHYTGVFSLFYGTQLATLSLWQAGTPLPTAIARIASSLMMVLTMSDPPRYEPVALPLLIGTVTALLAVAGFRGLRQLPLALVLFFLTACLGSLVARGSAYPGRFSLHLLGVASAMTICAAAFMVRAAFGIAPPNRG